MNSKSAYYSFHDAQRGTAISPGTSEGQNWPLMKTEILIGTILTGGSNQVACFFLHAKLYYILTNHSHNAVY